MAHSNQRNFLEHSEEPYNKYRYLRLIPNLQLTSAGRTGTANGPQIALGPHFAQVWSNAYSNAYSNACTSPYRQRLVFPHSLFCPISFPLSLRPTPTCLALCTSQFHQAITHFHPLNSLQKSFVFFSLTHTHARIHNYTASSWRLHNMCTLNIVESVVGCFVGLWCLFVTRCETVMVSGVYR